MTVSLSSISGTLSATAIDTNFDNLQKLFIEGIENGDIDTNKLDKYVLRRYTDGRLTSATVGSYPLYDGAQQQKKALLSLTPDFVNPQLDTPTSIHAVFSKVFKESHQSVFEMLGTPGPSFYVDGQEDGTDLTSKTIIGTYPQLAALAGIDAVPQYLYKRFPENECWSRWLTVPQCSVKVFIPEPCVAMVNAQFAFYPGPGGTQYRNASSSAKYWEPNKIGALQLTNACRVGLVVDTNPVLRDGVEFANSNANIRDPADGSQASHVSWKVFEQKAIRKTSTTISNVRGAVALAGGTWYNFSCKYRDAATHGFLAKWDYTNGSPNHVIDNLAEGAAITNWVASYLAGGAYPTDSNQDDIAQHSIGDFFWINTNMQVELFYGRTVAEVNDISNADIHTTPTQGY